MSITSEDTSDFILTADIGLINNNQWSCLHFASSVGNIAVIELLLNNGVDIYLNTSRGLTALHIDSRLGLENVVRLLLDNGADIEVSMNDGLTSLFLASHCRHLNIVSLLLEKGAIVNSHGGDNHTCLTHLSTIGSRHENVIKVIKLLLNNGANINIVDLEFGMTPLMWASFFWNIKTVRILLENNADIHMKCNDSCSALLYALDHHPSTRIKDFIELIKILLEHGANINDKYESGRYNGFTSFHVACTKGIEEVVVLFIENGADIIDPLSLEHLYTPNIKNILKSCESMVSWRPWNHHNYTVAYKQTITTLHIIKNAIL